MEEKEISRAVISRLPIYYRYLGQLYDENVERVSSKELSTIMRSSASQIRQDLNCFGGFGQQGYGYNVKYLYEEIGKILGLDKKHNLVLIGAGNLGQALVKHLKKAYGDEYQIVSLYSYCQYADIPSIADLTPFEWSRIFSLFDITFSKYFHGTLLSIINGTPVISLSAEEEIKGIPAKVEDVLTRLDLMDFYFPAKNSADINWKKFMHRVNNLIENPPVEKMLKGVEKEKKYADSFFEYIRTLV